MASTINMTVLVPEGTTNHGTQNLICSPTKWTHYLIFFAINYVAHAFTLMSPPGATTREIVLASICALFVPGSGIIRSLRWLFLHALTESSQMERAIRAGAICMVVHKRNAWKGSKREKWFSGVFKDQNVRLVPLSRQIHGKFDPPQVGRHRDNYFLAEVPPNTPLKEITMPLRPEPQTVWEFISSFFWTRPQPAKTHTDMILPHKRGILQSLFGLGQTLYGVYTLYMAKGDQIDEYGMLAFGLTVTPYVFMSIINTLASLVTPQYSGMYLIRTPDMGAAEKDGGTFGGEVAEILINNSRRHTKEKVALDFLNDDNFRTWLYRILLCVLVVAPIGIIGGFAKFRLNIETNSINRIVWVLLWLVLGAISSFWIRAVEYRYAEFMCQYGLWYRDGEYRLFRKSIVTEIFTWLFIYALFVVPLWVPAIGGMVQIGFMMRDYGSCIMLDFNPFG